MASRASNTSRTSKRDAAFFAALAQGAPVTQALATCGYTRSSAYRWKDEDPAFAQQWEQAVDTAVELMEREADRRAIEGVLEPVYWRGQKIGEVRKYSDVLLIFRLKALRPDKYRDNVRQENVGDSGGPVTFRVVYDNDNTSPTEAGIHNQIEGPTP